MSILVRNWGKCYYYKTSGYGLKINSFTIKDGNEYYGFIENWYISNGNNNIKGFSQSELIEYLKSLASTIKPRLKKGKVLKNSKDMILIYTDNLQKAKGFLQPIITEDKIEHCFQVCNNIEFRDINQFNDECETALDIAKYAQFLFDELFIPDNDVYLTAPQWARHRIKKALGKNNISPSLMPMDYATYVKDRKAIFGGMHWVKRIRYNYTTKNDVLIKYFDITSAYPYVMTCKKYQAEPLKSVNPDEYKNYDLEEYFTIGTYIINYDCKYSNISTYKDIYGKNLIYNEGLNTTKIRCCGTDLITISKMCDSIDIMCIELSVAKIDYLPKEIIDEIIYQFKKKENLRGTGAKYDLQKIVVNSISGDLTRKAWDNYISKYLSTHKGNRFIRDKYNNLYKKFVSKKCIYSMYWGIQVTAYVRAIIFDICQKTDAIYGDTDGLFFYGYKENLDIIYMYNKMIDKELQIEKLGRFKEEDTSDIDNFIAFNVKSYAYTSIKAKGIIKHFSGMNKEFSDKIDYDIFTKRDYKLNYGFRNRGVIKKDRIEYNSFISDGYYYEDKNYIKDAEDILRLEYESIFERSNL